MAADRGPGIRSPVEHPYPLCCLFFKQIQSLTKVKRVFLSTISSNTQLRSPWLKREKCLPSPKLDSVAAAEASLLPWVWSSLTHTLLPSLTGCIQVPSSHCGAESNVTGPGCSVLPPPCKGPISAEGYHHTGSLGREWEGGSVWKEGKMWRSGQPIWKATCGLLGLHLLLGLCYWTCGRWLNGSGVQSYKTPARTVWVAGSGEPVLSDRSSTLITGKFSCCSLQSWFSYIWERLSKLNPGKSPWFTTWNQMKQDGRNCMFSGQPVKLHLASLHNSATSAW